MSKPLRGVGAAIVVLLLMVGYFSRPRSLMGQLRPEQEKAIRQVAGRQSGYIQVGKYVINRQRIDYMVSEDNGELRIFLGGRDKAITLSAEEARQVTTEINPLRLGSK
jgi:hypothetical protein